MSPSDQHLNFNVHFRNLKINIIQIIPYNYNQMRGKKDTK